MPKRTAPEFYWDEGKKLYRKRIKDEATGKWVSVYAPTKAALREKVEGRRNDLARDAAKAANPYVHEYAAKWYALNTVGLSASRCEDYRTAINLHICPVIGSMLVADVKPDDVRRVMAAAAGLSKSMQQKLVTTLKRIFAAAEENGLIAKNPCTTIKPGGDKPKPKVPLTDAQAATLISALEGTRCQLFVMIGLYAGLRREEICALKWDCVHLDAEVPYIEVRRAIRWEHNRAIVSDKLKSDAAERNVPLAPQLLEALRAASVNAKEFVVTDASGKVLSETAYRRMWDAVELRSTGVVKYIDEDGKEKTREKKLGDKVRNHDLTISIDFHVTPHQLRHTFITNLLMNGAPIKTVQYLAGHATVQMTLDVYAHLLENTPADTVGALNLAFAKPAKDASGDKNKGDNISG